MKTPTRWIIPQALGIMLATVSAAGANQILQLAPQILPDPLVVQGTSGGGKNTDCGYISETPNQVIEVTQPFPYLRFSVQSVGSPTLLIDGPGGRFCVLADTYSGGKPEMSGLWTVGTYNIYVGDRSNSQHPYSLSISPRPN